MKQWIWISEFGQEARLLLLGGEPFGVDIEMWWNFVARTKDEIEQAYRAWESDERSVSARSHSAWSGLRHPSHSGWCEHRSHYWTGQNYPTHDQAVESPSFLESLIQLPGTLLQFPGRALQAMDALNDLADRVERLMTLLERLEGGVTRSPAAGSTWPRSVSPKPSAGSKGRSVNTGCLVAQPVGLRFCAAFVDRATAGDRAPPKQPRQDVARIFHQELAKIVGTLDERFGHLDLVVTDMARLVEAVIGTIPGMRRVLRTTTVI